MKYNKSWVSILFGNTAKGVIRLSRDNLLLGKNNKGKFLHRQKYTLISLTLYKVLVWSLTFNNGLLILL